MLKVSHRKFILLSCFVSLLFFEASLYADSTANEIAELRRRLEALEKKQLEESSKLEKKTDTIAEELSRTKLGNILPEKTELKSAWGMGPAASSVYNTKRGLSIGGYGEGTYRSLVEDANGKKDQADLLRLVTYLGYKFNDSIVFNSEIELEHATTDEIGGDDGDDGGEVSVEFAYLDFLGSDEINGRLGMVLIPMGLINEMHEPPFFHGVVRPEVERRILPSTWSEHGVGIFGRLDLAGALEYKTYLVNGLRASRFADSGIREGRQAGNRALFEDIAWTSRLDYSPETVPGLLIGGSGWVGNSGQDETFAGETPNVRTLIGDLHAQYKMKQLELRALGSWGSINDADLVSTELGETVGDRFNGWYGEVAYDILPHLVSGTNQYLAPFFRYESLDTQDSVPSGFVKDESFEKQVYTFGLTYKPISDVVLKLDYRNFETDGDNKTADEVAFGFGFVF